MHLDLECQKLAVRWPCCRTTISRCTFASASSPNIDRAIASTFLLFFLLVFGEVQHRFDRVSHLVQMNVLQHMSTLARNRRRWSAWSPGRPAAGWWSAACACPTVPYTRHTFWSDTRPDPWSSYCWPDLVRSAWSPPAVTACSLVSHFFCSLWRSGLTIDLSFSLRERCSNCLGPDRPDWSAALHRWGPGTVVAIDFFIWIAVGLQKTSLGGSLSGKI